MRTTYLQKNLSSKIRVGCPAHNCGGCCLLIAHIENGRITRLEADDRPVAAPQLRACPRGRAYLRRQYHSDWLLHPLKRTGPRGEGQFKRITWDEALDTIAAQFERVKAAWVRVGVNAEMVAWSDMPLKGCLYPLDVALERFYTGTTRK
ncbi:MAG: molybdopterin-dependent oxidoreductase, partial [Candidatus Villigracilaceae bacterium]